MCNLAVAVLVLGVAVPAKADVDDALRGLCVGLRSFNELTSAAGAGRAALLETIAPTRVRLPADANPSFGAQRINRRGSLLIAGGKAPLVVHPLAPKQRPCK